MKADRVILILPGLEEGGVERHVMTLSRALDALGTTVTVVSSGGPLVARLSEGVRHIELPVHRKNLPVGLSCARRLAEVVRTEGIGIVHAHSRVPAWIAYFIRRRTGVKFVYTAHARYSLNLGLWPLRRADGVLCVSEAVRAYLADWLPRRAPVEVVYNALDGEPLPWRGSGGAVRRLLFLGRLARKKGAALLLEALASLDRRDWLLDVVGDGPQREELEERAERAGLAERVHFHGYRERAAEWIAACDLFCFPSQDEGMGLVLAEALRSGAPVLASDLAAVRELTNGEGLLPPEDVRAWAEALSGFLDGSRPALLRAVRSLPTPREMATAARDFYGRVGGGGFT